MNQPTHQDLSALLETATLASIGPTRRDGVLASNTLRDKLAELQIPPGQHKLLLALLLLWHDHLDESHCLSQEIETPDGSLLHGMMHRREPDYANSKYWFRRAGKHPAHAELPRAAAEILQPSTPPEIPRLVLRGDTWDAAGFVDACERSTQETAPLLQRLQKAEFQACLHYFLRS